MREELIDFVHSLEADFRTTPAAIAAPQSAERLLELTVLRLTALLVVRGSYRETVDP